MSTEKPRLRFRRQERERGLARIGAAPRGWDLMYGDENVGYVSPLGGGWRGEVSGWYFVACRDNLIPLLNTCYQPNATPEDIEHRHGIPTDGSQR